MAVNWKRLEDNIVQAIKERRARNEDAFAKLIADEYDRAIIHKAADMILGNTILVAKKSLLESALRGAFQLAKLSRSESEAQRIMKSFINTGVIAYWTGAQLTLTKPPPGAVSVVTNQVVSPGTPPDVSISNASKPEVFAREFVIRLQAHAKTVSIVTTGVTANGAPVVVTINGIN